MTVREALQQSLNAATMRLAQDVGLPTIVERARAFGIESRLDALPAMALGSFEVTPLELARAYLPFVNGGRRTPPAHAVRAVQERGGAVDTGDDEAEGKSVISPAERLLGSTSITVRPSIIEAAKSVRWWIVTGATVPCCESATAAS